MYSFFLKRAVHKFFFVIKGKTRIEIEKKEQGYESYANRVLKASDKLDKGVWGMPRLPEAKKDVISCEKLRGLAHTR